jgi:hypothetical protein
VARRLPASVSPTVSGYWIGADELGLPFYAAALCLALNAFLYYWWFHDIRPLDEPERPTPERDRAAIHQSSPAPIHLPRRE